MADEIATIDLQIEKIRDEISQLRLNPQEHSEELIQDLKQEQDKIYLQREKIAIQLVNNKKGKQTVSYKS